MATTTHTMAGLLAHAGARASVPSPVGLGASLAATTACSPPRACTAPTSPPPGPWAPLRSRTPSWCSTARTARPGPSRSSRHRQPASEKQAPPRGRRDTPAAFRLFRPRSRRPDRHRSHPPTPTHRHRDRPTQPRGQGDVARALRVRAPPQRDELDRDQPGLVGRRPLQRPGRHHGRAVLQRGAAGHRPGEADLRPVPGDGHLPRGRPRAARAVGRLGRAAAAQRQGAAEQAPSGSTPQGRPARRTSSPTSRSPSTSRSGWSTRSPDPDASSARCSTRSPPGTAHAVLGGQVTVNRRAGATAAAPHGVPPTCGTPADPRPAHGPSPPQPYRRPSTRSTPRTGSRRVRARCVDRRGAAVPSRRARGPPLLVARAPRVDHPRPRGGHRHLRRARPARQPRPSVRRTRLERPQPRARPAGPAARQGHLHRPSTASRWPCPRSKGTPLVLNFFASDLHPVRHRDAGPRVRAPAARDQGDVPRAGRERPHRPRPQALVKRTKVTYRTAQDSRRRGARHRAGERAAHDRAHRRRRATIVGHPPRRAHRGRAAHPGRRQARRLAVIDAPLALRLRRRDAGHREPVRVRHAPRLPRVLPRRGDRRPRTCAASVQRSLAVGLAVSAGFLAVFSLVGAGASTSCPPRSTAGRRGRRSSSASPCSCSGSPCCGATSRSSRCPSCSKGGRERTATVDVPVRRLLRGRLDLVRAARSSPRRWSAPSAARTCCRASSVFVAYSLGMTLVLLALTVSMGLAQPEHRALAPPGPPLRQPGVGTAPGRRRRLPRPLRLATRSRTSTEAGSTPPGHRGGVRLVRRHLALDQPRRRDPPRAAAVLGPRRRAHGHLRASRTQPLGLNRPRMGRFAELLAHDGVVEDLELRSRFGFLAFHGGNLEVGTDVVATQAAAEAGASLYAVRQPEGLRWHVPSIEVTPDDRPPSPPSSTTSTWPWRCTATAATTCGPPCWPAGGNRAARRPRGRPPPHHPARRLRRGRRPRRHPRASCAASTAHNPVNRCAHGGVQLELPPRVRSRTPFWADLPDGEPIPHVADLVARPGGRRPTWPVPAGRAIRG